MKANIETTGDAKIMVYFIDDEPVATRLFERTCRQIGLDCETFLNGEKFLNRLQQKLPDMVLTDLNMPKMDGFEIIQTVVNEWPSIPVIAITGQSTVERAVKAMKLGASDFLKKPYKIPELETAIQRCLKFSQACEAGDCLTSKEDVSSDTFGMVGQSAEMWRVFKDIQRLAKVDCSVIIQGESGTGKELAAKAIHNCGERSGEPFIAIDCGSLTDTLLESELFGHKKGAFTGASADRTGLFEAAGQGTIFLDEIGNISDSMQAKLLRVCQEKEILPVGTNQTVPIDARFIVASNQNLDALVKQGKFRHDLYYRLNVITICMPALSQRREDIPLLVEHFVKKYSQQYKRPLLKFSQPILNQLQAHYWRGNIRELANFIERCIVMMDDDNLNDCIERFLPQDALTTSVAEKSQSADLQPATLEQMEMQHINKVLESVGGNQVKAAKILGINRSTLWRKLGSDQGSSD
ncbi:MAG: sigma-54-dependent Fis family transcriptional regulator [Gammaproteobacteria bacterium]|nr:sigma-54-dependent Fis family transcriptional regulator [Gammaproteobacteria bacterium]